MFTIVLIITASSPLVLLYRSLQVGMKSAARKNVAVSFSDFSNRLFPGIQTVGVCLIEALLKKISFDLLSFHQVMIMHTKHKS